MIKSNILRVFTDKSFGKKYFSINFLKYFYTGNSILCNENSMSFKTFLHHPSTNIEITKMKIHDTYRRRQSWSHKIEFSTVMDKKTDSGLTGPHS